MINIPPPKIIRYEAATAHLCFAESKTTSANIVPITLTKNGKHEKTLKGICRIFGPESDIESINAVTVKTAAMLNEKLIDTSIFEGKKSFSAVKLTEKLDLIQKD
jgi:hypothetical protein